MEFREKLQKLRVGRNLTQEELAKELYVSRTAVSKWESGRGYPSIDSLKTISSFFAVPMEVLLSAEDPLPPEKSDRNGNAVPRHLFLCGMLDAGALLLFLLPVFGTHAGDAARSVAFFALSEYNVFLKVLYAVLLGALSSVGVFSLIVSGFAPPRVKFTCLFLGMWLSVFSTAVFLLSRQPYAGIFVFAFLTAKTLLFFAGKRHETCRP